MLKFNILLLTRFLSITNPINAMETPRDCLSRKDLYAVEESETDRAPALPKLSLAQFMSEDEASRVSGRGYTKDQLSESLRRFLLKNCTKLPREKIDEIKTEFLSKCFGDSKSGKDIAKQIDADFYLTKLLTELDLKIINVVIPKIEYCAICRSDIDEDQTFERGFCDERHVFHKDCVDDALKIQPDACPSCRGSFYEPDKTKWFEYAINGDLISIKYLISRGIDIERLDDVNGCTALILACMNKHKDIVKLLLAHGANVNATDKHGKTPLMIASQNRYTNIERLLLNNMAHANPLRALINAAERGHVDIAYLAIQNGANVNDAILKAKQCNHTNVIEFLHNIMLIQAIKKQNVNDIKLLLAEGANVNIATKLGTPLIHAAEIGNKEIVELLIKRGAELNRVDDFCASALYYASLNGHIDIVDLLIAHGANTIEAFATAIRNERKNIIKLLLSKETSCKEKPFIIYATKQSRLPVINLLLECGAFVDATDSNGNTALLIATQSNSKLIMAKLLAHKANVNVVDKLSITPLIYAAKKGYKEVVELLIQNGADIKIADKYGRTAVYHASINKHADIVKLLLEQRR